MHSEEDYSTWERLYSRVHSSHERFPVDEWLYTNSQLPRSCQPMEIWPILKNAILMRMCHFFHAEGSHLVLAEEVRNRPENILVKLETQADIGLPQGTARDASALFKAAKPSNDLPPPTPTPVDVTRRWPDRHADILFFGSRICDYRVGDVAIQNHFDLIRLAAEDCGYRTATLLQDVVQSDVQLEESFLGATFGFETEFKQASQFSSQLDQFEILSCDMFEQWVVDIRAIYPIERLITRRMLNNILNTTYSTYACLLEYFKRCEIKAVFLYAYYGTLGYAAAKACREIGIPCVDIQHGVTNQGHEAYNWSHLPDADYSVLPTHLALWTNADAELINKNQKARGPKAFPIGHSWRLAEELLTGTFTTVGVDNRRLNRVRQKYLEIQQQPIPVKLTEETSSLAVLITLRSDENIDWLIPLFENNSAHHVFLIRLHPKELLDPAALASRKSLEQYESVLVEWPSVNPMPVVLEACDIHVTKYSSSVLDAQAYGVPSICYSMSARWYYPTSQYPFVENISAESEALRVALDCSKALKSRIADRPWSADHASLQTIVKAVMQGNAR